MIVCIIRETSRVQRPASRVQRPESGVQSQASRVKRPESRNSSMPNWASQDVKGKFLHVFFILPISDYGLMNYGFFRNWRKHLPLEAYLVELNNTN